MVLSSFLNLLRQEDILFAQVLLEWGQCPLSGGSSGSRL
jgi:hypothetical protein